MPLITVHNYSTHLPALVGCVSQTEGRVLELGAGVYSTPILHSACAGRELVTADNNAEWLERFLYLQEAQHQLEVVHDWEGYDRLDERWDVALVDQTPRQARPMSIERLRSRCRFIVVHDINDSQAFGYEPLLSSFRYRQDFTELGVAARTAVVSDAAPVPFTLPDPTGGHGAVVIASSPIELRTSGAGWALTRLKQLQADARHFFVAGTVELDNGCDVDMQILFCDSAERPLWWVGVNKWVNTDGDGSFCIPRDAASQVPPSAGGVEGPSWAEVRNVVVRARSSSPATVRLSELRLLAWADAPGVGLSARAADAGTRATRPPSPGPGD